VVGQARLAEPDAHRLDVAAFAEHAETAKKNCPVSAALTGIEISLNTRLASRGHG
jgi:organic hydroperoxide reductase OsmC/OhrA